MCLERVVDVYDSTLKERYGYKIFIKDKKGKLHSELYGGVRARNRWIEDLGSRSLKTVSYCDVQKYKRGFHAFTSIKGARCWRAFSPPNYVICRVKLQSVHTKGKQLGYYTLVAKRMLILEEIN